MSSQNLTKNKVKVCHLSSVHFALDTRIFFRFCQTLSHHYNVTLIAVHPVKEIKNGILIIPFKRFHNRKIRVAIGWILMFFKAIRVNARIYQIHDPELIPCGMLLKLFGKQVILDIHENIAEDIFDKPWIKNQKRVYKIFTWFESPACKNFRIMLAENSYEKRYHLLAGKENCTTVRNFCNYNFFKPYVNSGYRNLTNLFYIGIVLENRGILEIA
ncbi:MAG: hypothetical protein H7321_03035, partial [Bacteroidia bacterium]|nr:hypothetical protein [Bacteroidia bacterium]